jgi:EAL domain-containing protein (putative c-di-GMP-specific phosphodiesterase class I)/ActR/RegA family two-component response regulator
MTMALATHATVRFPSPTHKGAILLIEDDAPLARSLVRVIKSEGYEVVHAESAAAAVELVKEGSFDAVLSDLNLPGASGVDVLNLVRAYDPDVPLVLMTGAPTVDTAIEACNLGVLEYLVKPTPRDQLARVLGRATTARRLALHKREASDSERDEAASAAASAAVAKSEAPTVRPTVNLSVVATLPAPAPASGVRSFVQTLAILNDNTPAVVGPVILLEAPTVEMAAVDVVQQPRVTKPFPGMECNHAGETSSAAHALFDRAMTTLEVDLEPIADAKSKSLLGFAARMRSEEETLTTDSALVVMATRLDRLEELRRRVRDLAVRAFVNAPPDALLFVDVHPSDLLDGDLYSPEPPLARIADRVVLQVRARGLAMADLGARASVLRFVGFRLAIADLDAGQACLAQIADLAPEFVKIDARLVKGLDGSLGRRRLVSALVSMCRSLDAVSIAEGVSTAEEREALLSAGCNVVQGPIAARHAPPSTRRQPLTANPESR